MMREKSWQKWPFTPFFRPEIVSKNREPSSLLRHTIHLDAKFDRLERFCTYQQALISQFVGSVN
jgi:hypothetical protein